MVIFEVSINTAERPDQLRGAAVNLLITGMSGNVALPDFTFSGSGFTFDNEAGSAGTYCPKIIILSSALYIYISIFEEIALVDIQI